MKETSKTVRCYACGDERASVYLRPFGLAPDGQPKTWICDNCDGRGSTIATPALTGGPRISAGTLVKASQLAHQGAGWSVDHVLQTALALLEDRASRERVS